MKSDEVEEAYPVVVEDGYAVSAQTEGRPRSGALQSFGSGAMKVLGFPFRPIRKFCDLPDLEKPVAELRNLPQNSHNYVSSVLVMTGWAWKMMEFKMDPTRKGWAAIVRMFLTYAVPVLLLGVVSCAFAWLVQMVLGVSAEILKLVLAILLGCAVAVVALVVLAVVHCVFLRFRLKWKNDSAAYRKADAVSQP